MRSQSFVYPFAALLGQEKMKKALLLNAVNPGLGGVLIRGEKGTAKSTAVRALAALLPEIPVIAGCPYVCDPLDPQRQCISCRSKCSAKTPPFTWKRVQIVDLPVSATEDRLVGNLDFRHALKHGERRFEPGLLAKANRGILYVDEINLLDDHLVDLLLDAAALGVNYVEREGISYSHPAQFILVGTMNPEEGELRPQLIDRFGLCVQVEGEMDPKKRVEIIRRRGSFDEDPLQFLDLWAEEQEKISQKIIVARQLLPEVKMARDLEEMASWICIRAMVAGHRGDLVMVACARTIAAFSGRKEVTEADVLEAAEYVLPHRLRDSSQPNEPQSPEPREDEESQPERSERGDMTKEEDRQQKQEQEQDENRNQEQEPDPQEQDRKKDVQPRPAPSLSTSDVIFGVGEPFPVRRITYREKGVLKRGSGRRSRGQVATKSGRYVRSSMRWERKDLAFDATLRAAAPHQKRRRHEGLAVVIRPEEFREKIREKKVGNLLIFVVDASGSMGAEERMVEAKGAILSLLLDAYQKRDRVGMVAFRGDMAEVILPSTSSVELAEKLLADLPTGGRTPLSLGLLRAYDTAQTHLVKDPDTRPLLVVISDGKANVSLGEERPLTEAFRVATMIKDDERIKSLVIDAEAAGFVSFGLAKDLAKAMDADYYQLAELKADGLVQAVNTTLQWESLALA